MKVALAGGTSFIKKNFERVIICCAIAERRVFVLSGQLLQGLKQDFGFPASDFDFITGDVYDMLNKNTTIDLTRTSWFRPLQRQYKDSKPEEIKG